MKTARKIVNLKNENISPLKVSLLRKGIFWITYLCQNTHLICKIFQYTCSYVNCGSMFPYNKHLDFQYARLQIFAVHLHLGLFWSTGIPTALYGTLWSQMLKWTLRGHRVE